MPFNHQGYTVSWSPYVEGIVEPAENQNLDAALKEVLEYQAEKVIDKEPDEKTGYVLARFLSKDNPVELSACIDPVAHTIFFGTDAEVRDQLDED